MSNSLLRPSLRPSIVRIAVGTCLLAVACSSDPPAEPPRAVKRRVDTDRIPVPNHSPQVMSDPGKPRRVSQEGKMEADVGGRRQHFTFFSRGNNASAHFESKGVSWLKLHGALNDVGSPFLSFALEPVNLDAVEFPVSYTTSSTDGPRLQVRYEVSAGTRWTEADDATMTLTLTSFEDDVLTGTFAGTLRRQGTLEDDSSLDISGGAFEIKLRRTGDKKAAQTP